METFEIELFAPATVAGKLREKGWKGKCLQSEAKLVVRSGVGRILRTVPREEVLADREKRQTGRAALEARKAASDAKTREDVEKDRAKAAAEAKKPSKAGKEPKD